jgi:transposase-like protein
MQLAEEYGVSDVSVYRWRDEFLEGGEAALGGRDSQARQIQQLKREISERDRVVGELTIANRVLKKLSEELPSTNASGSK